MSAALSRKIDTTLAFSVILCYNIIIELGFHDPEDRI